MLKRMEEKAIHAVASSQDGVFIIPRETSGKVKFDVISPGAFTKGCPPEDLEEIILQSHSGKTDIRQAVNQ